MTYIQELRRFVGHRRLINPGARAIICNDAGEVLLQLRADFHQWGLPAGGMELGESAWQAIRREVREETGLEVIRGDLLGIYSDPTQIITYPNGDEMQVVSIAFIITEWQGELTDGDDETLALRFFPLDALPENLFPIHRQALLDFQAYEGHCFVH